ncbi:ABC transporter ATP-binding protein [Chryseolinea soli]|uniref:ABC transporter ATP-binding protein n=1 Tax=Chryseolinea soli TaxID=2321403 RepID=A0A385SPB1_9BACT|nr:ABC transporter ATP-binding protein [Chryseolinea soli]AYB31320.1 ABC transporter ATP-binding protein [Chryseolinea soli]
MKPILEIQNVSKLFKLHHRGLPYLSLRDRISGVFKKTDEIEEFWALNDVSFSVEAGESIGIIGRNGAGKSTLLKILSRITLPTKGRIIVRGRIASLLEVGTGFHQELTGRENIFMNGSILGMKKTEINKRFDEIVDFSGTERFLDTQLKHYSSGMQLRLAFAVAAHLEPEILIVDEVLSVGDAEFQKKCMGRMKHLSESEGRTVLFVSHQLEAVTRLCSKVIQLEAGKVSFQGNASEGVSRYLKGSTGRNYHFTFDDISRAPGNEKVRLTEVGIKSHNGEFSDQVDIRKPVTIFFKYNVLEDGVSFTHGLNIHNNENIHVLSSHDTETGRKRPLFKKGTYYAEVIVPGNFLAEGLYFVSVAVMQYDPFEVFFHEKEIVTFTVVDTVDGDSARGTYGGTFPGVVRPILNWEYRMLDKEGVWKE